MKLTIGIISILLGSLFFFGCSEHVPDKHEQLYLDTADSLSLYKDLSYLEKELAANEMARDFIVLDFESFKEKHKQNNEEMKVLSELMQGHISIAKTLNSFGGEADLHE